MNSNRWNSIICRVFSQFQKRFEAALRESPQCILTHWARSQERSTASAERWVLRAFGTSPARDRSWGDHAWGGARGRGGRSYPLAPLQLSAPGRPHTAEPGAPGEGVSGGPASQPLPVLLAASPPAVSREGAGPPKSLEVPRGATCAMQSRLLLLGVPGGLGDVASRRVRLLLRQVVRGRPGGERQRLEVRLMHAAGVTDSGNWARRLCCCCFCLRCLPSLLCAVGQSAGAPWAPH